MEDRYKESRKLFAEVERQEQREYKPSLTYTSSKEDLERALVAILRQYYGSPGW